MSAMSNWMAASVMNEYFRGSSVTQPAAVYLALYTTDPTDSDTGTELSGNAYARQQILFSAPTVVSGKTQIQNSTTITFPTATGSWGDVAYWGVRTASSGGQLLAYGSFTQTKAIALGDQLHIAINAITIILD